MGIFGGGPDSVMKKGARTSGRIVGISVRTRGSDPPVRVDEYAIELSDGRVVGVRQRLVPDDVVRIGMPVTAWVHRDDVVVDWAASTTPLGVTGTTETYAWKSVDPPDRGITDSTLGLDKAAAKWMPVTIDLRELRVETAAFGLATRLIADLVVTRDGDEPYGCEVKLDDIPHYARHLPTAGRRLNGFADPGRLDRIRLDWPAAAVAEPGVGAPSVAIGGSSSGPTTTIAAGTPAPASASGTPATSVVDPPPPINGVSFEQWLAIERELRARDVVGKPKEWDGVAAQFGVAPGAYATASGKWAMAMARRPDLAAAYAAAIA